MRRTLGLCLWVMVVMGSATARARDVDAHSYAHPEQVRVRHVDLDLTVDFDRQRLHGQATLTIERTSDDRKKPLILDSRGLHIDKVEVSGDGRAFGPTRFEVGKEDEILGSPIVVSLPENARAVRLHYSTGPRASGLQWLNREMTSSKRFPFLFTQSQAIHARSWIPLQDSPAVRVTYSARIRTPKDVLAVMSAVNDPKDPRTGEHRFVMNQAVPPYL